MDSPVASLQHNVLSILTIISYFLCFTHRTKSAWFFCHFTLHMAICMAMSIAKVPGMSYVFPVASSTPLEFSLYCAWFCTIALLTVPNVRFPSYRLLRNPVNSHIIFNWRRFVLQGLRAVVFPMLTILILLSVGQDVFTFEYDRILHKLFVSSVCVLELQLSILYMDSMNYLPLTELVVGYAWKSVFADAVVLASRIEVFGSFLLIEVAAWCFLALPIWLNRRWALVSLEVIELPSAFRFRFQHFVIVQTVIEVMLRSHPQMYADCTVVAALSVAYFHVVYKSRGITFGASHYYTIFMQFAVARRVQMPGPYYKGGIISVDMLRGFDDVHAEDAPEKLARYQYVPSDTDRIATLSYKHHMPFIKKDMRVKISKEDLALALDILEERNCTHVWIDFVQNAHNRVCGSETVEEERWFEEGVAPYILFEVIALWRPEQAMDSMWIRIEEMAALLGEGLYRARDAEKKWTKGLDVDFRLAIVQLGARTSVGELAGCRYSYNKAIDGIARSYGKSVAAGVIDLGVLSRSLVPDESDFVYRSQITLNLMVKLPGLMDTNFTVAQNGLEFLLGRNWSSLAKENGSVTKLQLDDRYRGLRVFSSRRINEEQHDRKLGEFDVVCAASSFSRTTFRVLSNAEMRTDGSVNVLRHKWLGEREVSMDGFYEVDRAVWIKW